MFEALVAALGIAVLSLIGTMIFGVREKQAVHQLILPIAVGVFLGVTFFELIPETLEASELWGPIAIAFGFFAFYLLSHILDTFHYHFHDEHNSCAHSGARKLLIGDAIHNIADGVVIASAFMVNPAVGILTTIGIALHEIPQEIAEYAVLIASGCTRSKATWYNLISALSILFGVFGVYGFQTFFAHSLFILTGIAAGNLLYIATADLIPELRTTHRDHFFKTFFATLCGLIAIGALITYTHSNTPSDTHTVVIPQ